MATITGENIEIYEAVVIDNIDAKALGRIKCCIASEMDSTITPTNIIPKNGSKVWVFKNTKALDDYRYWPMPDNTDDITDYIAHNNDENTKVIMANDNGYSKSLLTYDDKRGFVMQTNINSIFNLNPQGGYSLVSGNSYFVAKNNHYEIGENASEQAVLGNKLKDLLVTLSEGLKNLSITAAGNPYTTSLSQPIFDISKQINDALNTILSDNITIE